MLTKLVKRYHKRVSYRPFGQLESPTEDQLVSGRLYVEGWVIDPTGPGSDIQLTVDGRPIYTSIQRKARPDVELAYLDTKTNREATGFCATVETSQFPDGSHRLAFVARKSGEESIIAGRTIQTRNCTRSFLACRYLRGTGLEIGGLHNPQAVPRAAE